MTAIAGTDPHNLCASPTSNWLKQDSTHGCSTAVSYDSRGNLTSYAPDVTMSYDALNRQVEDYQSTSVDWQNLYNGGDERLVRITQGATGNSVTRREMARYLDQATPFALPTYTCAEPSYFSDVHCSDPDWGYIQSIYTNGITAGCGGGQYCPNTALTRAQMAVFLLLAEHGSTYLPPACQNNGGTIFTDVPCPGGTNVNWIDELYQEGIAAGCGGGDFCPSNPITEQQMAIYMSTAPLWPNYHPIQAATYTLRDGQNRVVTEVADSLPARDNVYLGNLLVASYVSNSLSGDSLGWKFHSSDHLGTVRLTWNVTPNTFESHKYWPYGKEVGTSSSPPQKISFAAMERDVDNSHYYDHARSHDFNLGRFVSLAKLGGRPAAPQSWNRFAYSRDNPLALVDPNGRAAADPITLSAAAYISLTAYAVYLYYVDRLTIFSHQPTSVLEAMNAAQASFTNSSTQGTGVSMSSGPSLAFPGWDPTVAPGEGWRWEGKGDPGSRTGNWHNPATGESLHPDLDNAKEGPHWDYKKRGEGTKWRLYPDGRKEPAKGGEDPSSGTKDKSVESHDEQSPPSGSCGNGSNTPCGNAPQ